MKKKEEEREKKKKKEQLHQFIYLVLINQFHYTRRSSEVAQFRFGKRSDLGAKAMTITILPASL